ncbi:hypothetical protein FYJ34_09515 [Clostridiaceae bacterium 68-1-5]|uniref:Uncharacterized protein n=1 Tax=Suipraeoptans intestinalis TaxID=2606628 RepID=A0A6N7V2V0_9FIRM|nr:hypothetical protein [Suipraeoptans intestinalis]MSR94487.1 hypothetical protein [Suipraeoptans intestinalis]
MKCPFCKGELTESKKNPEYMLCYACRKKFKKPQQMTADEGKQKGKRDSRLEDPEEKEKRFREEKRRRRLQKQKEQQGEETEIQDNEELQDLFEEEEGRFSRLPMILLAIAILAVAGVIVYLLW